MIKPEHIPPAVVEAVAKTLWPNAGPADIEYAMGRARAAIRAALAAWPGAHKWDTGEVWHQAAIVLPLTTENPDAEA